MPHAAFRGQTRDEVFFGTVPNLLMELGAARAKARERRLAANRNTSCDRCAPTPAPKFPVISRMPQLRTRLFGMLWFTAALGAAGDNLFFARKRGDCQHQGAGRDVGHDASFDEGEPIVGALRARPT
jgi:hypothetical protein